VEINLALKAFDAGCLLCFLYSEIASSTSSGFVRSARFASIVSSLI
jgi:hypothetical protein